MRGLRVLVVIFGALVLTACQPGPDVVVDGSYRALAAAGGEAVPAVTMEIQGTAVRIVDGTSVVGLTMGAASGDYTLCPPRGDGAPTSLDGPVDIGAIRFARPAIFGDCGGVSPPRVTLIDLDSHDDETLPEFSRWLEFCAVVDPDC